MTNSNPESSPDIPSEEMLRRHFLLTPALALYRPQDDPTFTASVGVVSVLANIRDKHGAIISSLGKDDFTILENNRVQKIRYFTRQTDLPLTLGLLIDTSMSQEHVLDSERSASFHFLDQVLRETKDKVFITQFDLAILTRQDLTSSYKDLNDALTAVNTPTRRELQNGDGRGTLLYDALIKECKEIMQPLHGRKAIILMTDGEDNGSDGTLANTIDAAQRADTLVYSILFSDARMASGFGRRVLENLSTDTGGGFFEVSKKEPIDQVFSTIQDELRSQYSLGYISDDPPTIGEFRKLTLKTADAHLKVQARTRYWATP